MHLASAASVFYLSLLIFAAEPAVSQSAAPSTAPPAPAPAAANAVPPASEAAAKHAKRTACLNDAKTKKLVGPDKKAFLTNCMGTP